MRNLRFRTSLKRCPADISILGLHPKPLKGARHPWNPVFVPIRSNPYKFGCSETKERILGLLRNQLYEPEWIQRPLLSTYPLLLVRRSLLPSQILASCRAASRLHSVASRSWLHPAPDAFRILGKRGEMILFETLPFLVNNASVLLASTGVPLGSNLEVLG